MFWHPQTQCQNMATFMFFSSECGKLKDILKEFCDDKKEKCHVDAKFCTKEIGCEQSIRNKEMTVVDNKLT
jgi:hypothetical protein